MAVQKRTGMKTKRISVEVRQTASARTGQGGNPIAINASDIGVVRTTVRNQVRR
ncbi:hypothetical protein [Gordoniibacillus kamchatkensis]|uniref:hypothetical protein n=1 Tax=Gordoniibacillus kamchatkensis TaxID=1590651 RepID=UPI000A4D1762|nr:hypothetical protein [Paenibacillus sp. VKM B-2647]